MKKELITGFFIGIIFYLFIFGIKVVKVLIKASWKFDMVQRGLYLTFSNPNFILTQLLILVLCISGSMTLYYLHKNGYFKSTSSKNKQ